MMDNEILVDKLSTKDLIEVIKEVHENLTQQRNAFENSSKDLMKEWQGKGAKGAERSINEILEGFTLINDNLNDLINSSSAAIESIDNLDKNIAKDYTE